MHAYISDQFQPLLFIQPRKKGSEMEETSPQKSHDRACLENRCAAAREALGEQKYLLGSEAETAVLSHLAINAT